MYDNNATLYEVTFVSYDYYSDNEHISNPVVLTQEEMRKQVTDNDNDKIHTMRMLTPSEVAVYRIGQDEATSYSYAEAKELRESIRKSLVKFLHTLGRAVEEKTSKKILFDIRFLASIGTEDDSVTFKSLEEIFEVYDYGTNLEGSEFVQAFLGGGAMELAKALDAAKDNTTEQE